MLWLDLGRVLGPRSWEGCERGKEKAEAGESEEKGKGKTKGWEGF